MFLLQLKEKASLSLFSLSLLRLLHLITTYTSTFLFAELRTRSYLSFLSRVETCRTSCVIPTWYFWVAVPFDMANLSAFSFLPPL